MQDNLRKKMFEKLANKIKKYKNIYIYGTGAHTEILLNYLNGDVKSNIIGLIEKYITENEIYGYKVYSLEEIKDNIDAIVISSDVYQQTIYERISYLKEEQIDIIKIYDDEFFMPTAGNIVYDETKSKYQVRILEEKEYEKWNDFVDESPQGAIFNKTWYLEAVQAKFRIYVCIDKGNNILGGMVLPESRPEWFSMPMITQTLGILLKDLSNLKYVSRISKEKDIIESLVNEIPKFKGYSINFNYNFTNWLPFMWKGYNQYCRYTYVIEDLSDVKQVKSNFKYNIKYDINKAIKNNIKIIEDLSIEELYYINKKTFERQNIEIPYTLEFLKNFDEIINKHNAKKSFFAIDENGRIHAANYVVFDNKSAYYLMGGGDPNLRSSGATSLALWEAIKFTSTVSNKFDFEGSCIKSIEEFFRAFGGTQKMYFNIWKR